MDAGTEASQPTGLFVGLSALDVIQLVERVPGPDQKVTALDLAVAAGGPAANAAVVFAALGGRATLVTRLGQDPAGSLVKADLAAHGVEVQVAPAMGQVSTTLASIMVTAATGERAVVSATDQGRSYRAATGAAHANLEPDAGNASPNRDSATTSTNYDPAPTTPDRDSDPTTPNRDPDPTTPGPNAADLMARIRPQVVLVDSHETDISIPITQAARAASVPVVMDCGAKKPWTARQLPFIDCAVVSAAYLPGGAEVIAGDLRGQGVGFGAVTDGGGPVTYWTSLDGPLGSVPTRSVKVVDSLAAGDFFHGALAFAMASDSMAAGSPAIARDSVATGSLTIAQDGPAVGSFAGQLAFAAGVAAQSVQEFGSRSWLAQLVATQ
ncbi:MAG: PfkB family carbohydrate kinase [Micrococcales bacterium]|nr:PfkB family carbohydrate kinase [Micrococcales bacterium]